MIRASATWRLVAVAGAAGLVLAACGGSDDNSSDSSGSGGSSSTGTPLFLVDGNVGTGPIGKLPPGTMTGVEGSLPGAEIGDDFRARLDTIDDKLPQIGYSYGPESYDAVTLIALAAAAAKSDAGIDIAKEMRGVSEGGTACTSFDECNKLLAKGEDIDYNGVSGPIEFDQFGDVTAATIGIYTYNSDNVIPGYNADADPDNPVIFNEGTLEPPDDQAPKFSTKVNDGASDDQLVLGGLLPITGSLASLGPPEIAGVKLAVQDVNDAGGVLGKDVKFLPGDSGDTTTDTAQLTVDKHLQQGADVIVGPASSGVTLTVIDKTSAAGVLLFGTAPTSPELTTYEDGGLFWRTSPSDVLQGRVLANQILSEGYQRIGIIVRNDSYGQGLADSVTQNIEDGGGEIVQTAFYDEGATNFNSQVQKMVDVDPEAIVLIGFDESGKIINEMVAQGIGPNS
jgi:ABC-type branched-subunit amino acid transport system substrate-binding protein